jgi:hypothetical protein
MRVGVQEHAHCHLDLGFGEPLSSAEMRSLAKGHMRLLRAEDVERIGVVPACLVPVGRGEDSRVAVRIMVPMGAIQRSASSIA